MPLRHRADNTVNSEKNRCFMCGTYDLPQSSSRSRRSAQKAGLYHSAGSLLTLLLYGYDERCSLTGAGFNGPVQLIDKVVHQP